MERFPTADVFSDEHFLRYLAVPRQSLSALLDTVDWEALAAPLFPLRERLTCAGVLEAFRPVLDRLSPEPEEGWLRCAYDTAVSLLYPRENRPPAFRDGALIFLQYLRACLDLERKALPFDFWLDFAFCTEEELSHSHTAEEYRAFRRRFREEYVYELLRLGREVTPFRALDHIAGVHHVAMSVARAFRKNGGLVDLALMSAAAAGHDFGKFGCRPGERVPYLHYYYTDQWFARRHLLSIGRIAANHSVWDLEIENLSAESLILVYADFRVKQERTPEGGEEAKLFSLKDAFGVMLNKLDNVDAAKRRRYEYVYAKLRDFEEYLAFFGVDTTLRSAFVVPRPRKDAALMGFKETVHALRHTAVEHNLRLMHRLSRERLFAATLESARSEKDPARIRAYVAVFEEYFTYLSAAQKEQVLAFLYELLLLTDGDVRLQAARLMGRILAKFLSGYKKETPADAPPNPLDSRPFALWEEYLEKLIWPDRRLTPRQASMIRYQAKTVADALLENCSPADAPRFLEPLLRLYREPEAVDADAAFALLDTGASLGWDPSALASFAAWWLERGEDSQKAAAMRLLRHLLPSLPPEEEAYGEVKRAVEVTGGSAPLLFLRFQLERRLGGDGAALWRELDRTEAMSAVFLDNLKTATPWVMKAAGVEYLLELAHRGENANLLHIATHFSNLIKVGENVVVRRMAGAALLELAPLLTADRRNEIAVELSEVLETGEPQIAQYIPGYLGQFALWLPPRELDEVIAQMAALRISSNDNAAAASLATVGAMAEHYADYASRFPEPAAAREARRRRLVGFLLKGLSAYREPLRQEALVVLGEGLFASRTMSYQDKCALFTLTAKKILFLLGEQGEEELMFFYTAAALSHIYRFIVRHRIESGPFPFRERKRVAFFPGTFDPFSLSHKGIVQAIRDLGFEVYLAVDEFSWSKKAQPSLYRRRIVSMSVADEFDVYLFPHDIPVNLATPGDLRRLRRVFAGRELYLTVGSDVVMNASSYKAPPSKGSVHELNHIVFRRSSDAEGVEREADLSCITGDVIQLQLPTHLESISSTRIRENIDLGRDISNLIDPAVQEFIFRGSLYLREPQYKPILRPGALYFTEEKRPGSELLAHLRAASGVPLNPHDSFLILRDREHADRILGFVSSRSVRSSALYDLLGDEALANYVRTRAAGKTRLLTGLHLAPLPGQSEDLAQYLMTEAMSRCLAEECSYALWWADQTHPKVLDLLKRQGFLPARIAAPRPLLLVDMRSPAVLLQNIPTILKEPFASDRQVRAAIREAHRQFQRAVCAMYPGTLVLSLSAETVYHRMVRRITEINGVPTEPTSPRVLGLKMCVPFGKLLRGRAVPNTVTKTIHTDKVFAPDLRSFGIEAFPGYAPLESQIRTIRSFRRPVVLVDDLLDSGNRMRVLDPLFRRERLDVDSVLVGLLSGRGRDLMAARGRRVDSIYFVSNMRSWFVESTMYPFIGGDAVAGVRGGLPGLTPAINLILPYAFPKFYRECPRQAVYRFSATCLENSRNILLALEHAYRTRYARNLTLSRLSEAVILPLAPDKGGAARYDLALAASACLEGDLRQLERMQQLMLE